MANRIQLRRDITANWENINPVLADGEMGYDIVTNEIRIGDGSTTWTGLTANTISAGGGGTVSSLTNGSYTATLNSSGQLVIPAPPTGIIIDATMPTPTSLPLNGQYDFYNFSGEILVNDILDGYVYKLLVGSGKVFMMGCTNPGWDGSHSTPGTTYTLASYFTIESLTGEGVFYRFTNLASSRTFNFVAIQSRAEA
jgi:hypothetical protein